MVASVGARNEYGHMHTQAKTIYSEARVPWYRTDRNGTVTIRSPGPGGDGFSITTERPGANLNGPGDRTSSQSKCAEP
jgi:beta-lactamase superfamily II metal-dependent hydrolase